MIAGVPYLLLDMGVEGRLPPVARSGLQGLYGRSVATIPNFVTAYVRDISLISRQRYSQLSPPSALSSFPASLENPALEYSGMYEDGWMGETSYVRLAGGAKAQLVVQGEVPAGAGKHLQVQVNGRVVASVPVAPGPLDVRVPVPASRVARRVVLHFAAAVRLAAPDLRPASIRLSFLGLAAPPGA
jgi:hypothetical protein